MDNETRGKINFVIFKAGEDMNGNMITSYARARFLGMPITKDSLRTWLSIARGMKSQDEQAGYITKSTGDQYNYPTSYPMTPSWDRQGRSVASDAQYNLNFKEEAIQRGKALCQSIFQAMANPRWSGNITLRGEAFQVGDLLKIISKVHGVYQIVRITQVSHTIDSNNGWVTSIQFEEDEKLIQLGLT
jgi:hypothetical protein